jgi:hypothetical protein
MTQMMVSSSASNRPTLMVLPVEDWPTKDYALWMAGIAPQTAIRCRRLHAATLCSTSIEHARKGYGRFLSVLAAHGQLNLDAAPADRATFETVALFFDTLVDAGNVPNSIKARLFHLRMALRIMVPGQDFDWLTRPDDCALDTLLPFEPKDDKFTPSAVALFRWGLRLMQAPEPDAWPELDHDRMEICRTFRNGLIIALLACRAPRLGSLAGMRLEKNLYLHNGECWVCLESEIVKNKRQVEYSLPPELTPYITRYLAEIRPQLLDPTKSDAVWGNGDGGEFTYRAIGTMIFRQSGREFGQSFGPHRFRDALATTLAEADHQNPGLAAVVLGISERVVTVHYRQARQGNAARKLQMNLVEERERTRAMARRSFGVPHIGRSPTEIS